jgi:endonuclease-3
MTKKTGKAFTGKVAKVKLAQTDKVTVAKIVAELARHYPDPQCALDFTTPEQLLFATILSAQCTDARVNIVTKDLFAAYPGPDEMAKAPLKKIEQLIRSTGFFRSKAKSLQAASQDLVELHGGHIPHNMDALTKLRGVGRKTANVVLGVAFGKAFGVVVDTHVRRLSIRLGLTRSENPVQIEKDLMRIVPENHWIDFSHWLIHHGRTVCKARKPACDKCFLKGLCPSAFINESVG